MAAPHLKAVPPVEDAPDAPDVTVADEAPEAAPPIHPTPVKDAASRNTKALLVATRDRIALAVDDPTTPARDLAALTKRLVDIAREIDSITTREREERERKRKERERLKNDTEAFDPKAI